MDWISRWFDCLYSATLLILRNAFYTFEDRAGESTSATRSERGEPSDQALPTRTIDWGGYDTIEWLHSTNERSFQGQYNHWLWRSNLIHVSYTMHFNNALLGTTNMLKHSAWCKKRFNELVVSNRALLKWKSTAKPYLCNSLELSAVCTMTSYHEIFNKSANFTHKEGHRRPTYIYSPKTSTRTETGVARSL